MFSCEFCEISKNTFFTEHLWATATEDSLAHFAVPLNYEIILTSLKNKLRCYLFLVILPALRTAFSKNLNSQIIALRHSHFRNTYYLQGRFERFWKGGALYVGHHGWPKKKILSFKWSKKAKIILETKAFGEIFLSVFPNFLHLHI